MPLSKEYILTLFKTPKIGRATVKAVNENSDYGITSISDLHDLIVETKKSNAKITIPALQDIVNANTIAQRILDACSKKEVSIISVNEKEYPIKLMRLTDYPILLYMKGALEAVNSNYGAAVIGTREPSPFGLKAGRRISSILARNGFTIVSGLAIGCDTVGHQGALDAGGRTVAVLASGVDTIYPKENTYLADSIIQNGGALISEYEVGFKPQRNTFVERDRLQAALSDGLVVVETGINGGTMHAVRSAREMKIPLGCITGHPESLKDFDKIQGNKRLLEDGAYPIGSSEQIEKFIRVISRNNDFEVLMPSTRHTLSNEHAPATKSNDDNPTSIQSLKEIAESQPTDKLIDINSFSQKLTEVKELLLKVLQEQQKHTEILNNLNFSQSNKEKATTATKSKTTKTPKPNQPELYEPGSDI